MEHNGAKALRLAFLSQVSFDVNGGPSDCDRLAVDGQEPLVAGAEQSLAKLGLGRAYVAAGDTAKGRAAYQDFLALWKDADSDIPILKEAKAEYAKLP